MRLLIVALLLTCATAQAATLTLPLPVVSFNESNCTNPGPPSYQAEATGWTSDGNFATGRVYASKVCALRVHSGRGPGIAILHVCLDVQWDLSGALVLHAVNPALTGYINYLICLPHNADNTPVGPFTNPMNPDYVAGTTSWIPWLETP